MSSEVQKNDIGTVFRITIKDRDTLEILNISSASTKQIIFLKPDGNKLTKNASFYTDGTDGKIQYTGISGDLDTVGIWKIQSYLILSNNQYSSDVSTFKVKENV